MEFMLKKGKFKKIIRLTIRLVYSIRKFIASDPRQLLKVGSECVPYFTD